MNKKELAEQIVSVLNDMAEADFAATAALTSIKIPFEEDIAHYLPADAGWQNGKYSVSMMEVLNGIISKCSEGPEMEIRAVCDYKGNGDYPQLIRFEAIDVDNEGPANGGIVVPSKNAVEELREYLDVLEILDNNKM